MGLNLENSGALDPLLLAARLAAACQGLTKREAPFVVDGMAEFLPVIDGIHDRIAWASVPRTL